jgi:hypothetical protein
MRTRFVGLAAVAVALAAWPTAAGAAPTVTVRVEGRSATLLPPTTVTLGPDDVTLADGSTCHGNTAAAALDKATAGGWDRMPFVSTILGESHNFTANDYWAEWVSNRYGGGLCTDALNEGDELLMLVDVSDATFNPTVFPLVVGGVPATVAPGVPFTVTVTQYRTTGTPGTSTPESAGGATVAGGGASATADGAGHATLVLAGAGPTTLRATLGHSRSAPVPVCVTTGPDGACGTLESATSSCHATGDDGACGTLASATSSCQTTGDDGACGTKDRRAPRGRILSIREGHRYAKGKGPRTLSGIVAADPSGLGAVRLRLTRNDGGRCSTFDGPSERFVTLKRCGAARGKWFDAGDRESWSYLLPARLGRGRYVLDVQARDRAGNVDTLLQRTRTRVVFRVS